MVICFIPRHKTPHQYSILHTYSTNQGWLNGSGPRIYIFTALILLRRPPATSPATCTLVSPTLIQSRGMRDGNTQQKLFQLIRKTLESSLHHRAWRRHWLVKAQLHSTTHKAILPRRNSHNSTLPRKISPMATLWELPAARQQAISACFLAATQGLSVEQQILTGTGGIHTQTRQWSGSHVTTGDASDTRSRSPAGTTIATTTGYITTRTFSAGEWAACLRSRVSAGSGGVAANVLSVSTLPMTNGSAACATLPASLNDADCEGIQPVCSGRHIANYTVSLERHYWSTF